MVDDLISRSALLEAYDKAHKGPPGRARKLIEKAPEAVIRCKDCISWDKGHTEECNNLDSVCFHNGWCKPDWFCADGERR